MRKAKGSGFKMRSGNTTSFKKMGSSPVKNVDPSYYSNLIGNLQMTPTPNLTPETPAEFDYMSNNLTAAQIMSLTPQQKAERAAAQKAARQAEIDAFNAAGGLSQAQNFDPTTGQFDPASIDYSLYQPSVSGMYPHANIQAAHDLGLLSGETSEKESDNPSISSDLQKELTDKLQKEEEEEYNPESYQGSLYDYSVKKRTPMSKKRLPKGKRGYKMKRK